MIDWLKRARIEPEIEPEIERGIAPKIELGGETVPIALRRHRAATRLTLRLAPDGSEVRITLPKWADTREAIAFAHARIDWLAQQRAKLPARQELHPGGELMIRGEAVKLAWEPHAARRPALGEGKLRVGGPLEGLEQRIRRWLEHQALALFEQDAAHYCDTARLGLVPVALSRAQKRWGSCSDQRRLRINWRLVQAPDFVRRSVVAHEVTHLVHFDHSPAFHALLEEIYKGDIKLADRWLKDNGRTLYTAFG